MCEYFMEWLIQSTVVAWTGYFLLFCFCMFVALVTLAVTVFFINYLTRIIYRNTSEAHDRARVITHLYLRNKTMSRKAQEIAAKHLTYKSPEE